MKRDETNPTLEDEALRASEERYRDLFENANDVVFTTDLQIASRRSTSPGRRSRVRAPKHWADIHPGRARQYLELIHERLRDQLAGKVTPPFEAEIIAKDGRRIPMEVSSRLMSRAGRPEGIQAIARDVSERKRLEGEFTRATHGGHRAAGRCDRSRLQQHAHGDPRLRCRAHGVLEPPDPRREHALRDLQSRERAANLTRQLLAFSRRQILHPRVIDLTQVVVGLSEMLRRLIGVNIELVMVPAANLHLIKVDPGQIEQVIMNLVVNARDAMPAGGRLTVETANADLNTEYVARHPDARVGSYVRLSVTDTGFGMNRERGPVFSSRSSRPRKQGRVGAGSATVFGIVKQSEAHIAVHTEVGRGSVFEGTFQRSMIKASAGGWPRARMESGPIFGLDDSGDMEDDWRMFKYHQYCPVDTRMRDSCRPLDATHHARATFRQPPFQ